MARTIKVRPAPSQLQSNYEAARESGGGIQPNAQPEFANGQPGFKNPFAGVISRIRAAHQAHMAANSAAEDASYVRQGQAAHYNAQYKIAMNRRAKGNG
jgi:hypothetical protein